MGEHQTNRKRWRDKPQTAPYPSAMQPDNHRMLDAIRQGILAEMPDIWAIYLYGSMATGQARPDSDIDIALLTAPGKTVPDVLALQSKLATLTRRDVDIVDLRLAGNILRKEVLTHGIPVHAADADKVLAWEGSAISELTDHQWRIRELLDDFQRSGIGYRQ